MGLVVVGGLVSTQPIWKIWPSGNINIAGWKNPTIWVDVSPTKNGGFFFDCYVRLPEGSQIGSGTPMKTNMTLEKKPFEDVSPIKNGDFPMSIYVSQIGSSYPRFGGEISKNIWVATTGSVFMSPDHKAGYFFRGRILPWSQTVGLRESSHKSWPHREKGAAGLSFFYVS